MLLFRHSNVIWPVRNRSISFSSSEQVGHYIDLQIVNALKISWFLVHGHYFCSVCWFVCLFVQFFSAVFDPISMKLGHMLDVWV